jgi:hypothetical protein
MLGFAVPSRYLLSNTALMMRKAAVVHAVVPSSMHHYDAMYGSK